MAKKEKEVTEKNGRIEVLERDVEELNAEAVNLIAELDQT